MEPTMVHLAYYITLRLFGGLTWCSTQVQITHKRWPRIYPQSGTHDLERLLVVTVFDAILGMPEEIAYIMHEPPWHPLWKVTRKRKHDMGQRINMESKHTYGTEFQQPHGERTLLENKQASVNARFSDRARKQDTR